MVGGGGVSLPIHFVCAIFLILTLALRCLHIRVEVSGNTGGAALPPFGQD